MRIGRPWRTVKREMEALYMLRLLQFLAPLAFVSPRVIEAIANGNAPADLTITALAKALPYSWAEQKARLGRSLE